MSYLDDLKKKGQNLAQNVKTAANTVGNVANGVKKTAQNVYNGVKTAYDTAQGVKQEYEDFKDYQNQQNQQAQQMAMGQQEQETDWLAEYDSYKAEEAARLYSSGAQSGASGGQAPNVTPAAQAALGEGAGQWKSELDGIMKQILNREKFEYNMNGDAMYQQYADMYKNQAKMAMQNAMAQNAALTGGYTSSYGQMVGQQAYAAQMQELNEVGMDLYNQELDRYIAEGDQLNSQYAMLAEREAQDYNRALDERNFEYQKSQDELAQQNYEGEFAYQKDRDAVSDSQWDQSFEYQQGRDSVSDEQWQKEFDTANDQWQQSMDYQASRDDVADAQWQAELDRYLANDATAREQWQAEYDRAVANDELAAEQWDKSFAEDQRQYDENMAFQQDRADVSDSQWQQELDRYLSNDKLAAEQWDKQFAAEEEQRGVDNAYRDATLAEEQRQYNTNMDYQKDRDAVGDSQWQQSFDYTKEQDTIANEQWEKSFAETQAQNDADNAYRDEALKEDQRQFDESLDWDKAVHDYMYGEDGFYVKQREDEQAYNTSEREASEKHDVKMQNDAQSHDVTMQNDAQAYGDKEYERMYGDYEYDSETGELIEGSGGFYTKQAAQDQENWQAEFDREGEWYDDAQEAAKTTTTYEGEGDLNGQEVPKVLAGTSGLTTTNTNLFDETGSLKSVAIVKTTPTGDGTDSSKDVVTYNIGGKEVELRRGYSPYTNTKNPDATNGTFNGYQPDNVTSYYDGDKEAGKLSKAGFSTIINGQETPVYVDGKGKEWVYDAANNKYEEYEYEEKTEPTKITLPTPTGGKANVEMKPTGFR